MTTPVVYSAFTPMGFPSLSLALSMLKVARTMAMVMNSDASASSLPGQMRRPNPNAMLCGSNSGLSPRKRSGLKSSGFLYALGSCENHLQIRSLVLVVAMSAGERRC